MSRLVTSLSLGSSSDRYSIGIVWERKRPDDLLLRSSPVVSDHRRRDGPFPPHRRGRI